MTWAVEMQWRVVSVAWQASKAASVKGEGMQEVTGARARWFSAPARRWVPRAVRVSEAWWYGGRRTVEGKGAGSWGRGISERWKQVGAKLG